MKVLYQDTPLLLIVHDILITTMLNGVAVIDAALLLITANIPFPQTQL